LRIVGVLADFTVDHLLFPGIDLTIRLGRRDQRPQHRVAVFLDLGPGQQIGRCGICCGAADA
jgi:hypothetical protein